MNPQLSSTPNKPQENVPLSVAKSPPKQSGYQSKPPNKTQNNSVSQKRRMTSPLCMDPQSSTFSQLPPILTKTHRQPEYRMGKYEINDFLKSPRKYGAI